MKRLILLRHAKAVAKRPDDFGRELASRGHEQMKAVAKHLRKEELSPDLALVSPSARTRETWSLAGLSGVETRYDERIYEAEADDLLAVLHEVEPDFRSVMMVGHNPAFEELARDLAGSGRKSDLKQMASEYPTASVAVIDFEVQTWIAVASGGGRLASFFTPGGD